MQGRLILIPVPIGAENMDYSIPRHNLEMMNSCKTFIVEELRTARRFLKHAGYAHAIDDTTFHILNEHSKDEEIIHYLDSIKNGEDVGLMSEAGLPCIADPGMMITRIAQTQGISIVPLVGPSSLMLSLMASGLNGQNFAFVGYLPVDRNERAKAIRNLEQKALRENQTQIFIEAPYRNNQMMQTLVETLHGETRICTATDITLPTEEIRTLSATQWHKKMPELHKRNTVFLIGR